MTSIESLSTLKPYTFHGIGLSIPTGSNQAVGDCPLCGREGKFYVSIETGQWDCKKCSDSGNTTTFLQKLWQLSSTHTDYSGQDAKELAADRKLVTTEPLQRWGVAISASTNDWIVPAYSITGNICQLYRYLYDAGKERNVLFATPTFGHGILGLPLLNSAHEVVYICEGLWDGLAMWEALRLARNNPTTISPSSYHHLSPTSNESISLLSVSSVISTPSCSVFPNTWVQLFGNKEVVLLYDNDHPTTREIHGKPALSPPVSYQAMRKVVGKLANADALPRKAFYLGWAPDGSSQYNKLLPSGYDVRDLLSSKGRGISSRVEMLSQLLCKIRPIPTEWISGRSKVTPSNKSAKSVKDHSSTTTLPDKSTITPKNRVSTPSNPTKNGELITPPTTSPTVQQQVYHESPVQPTTETGPSTGFDTSNNGSLQIECLPCTTWAELTNSWRKCLRWTTGLDRTLSVTLAVITSTKALGDQLWVKVVGPASCGKSTLCEALSINRKYVKPVSTITGLHSGYKTDRDGDEDNSLIAQISDKTLIIKDGDTLLTAPNKDQILAEARDLYDCTSRSHYRNSISREYHVRVTVIISGTESLRILDDSELGERFLDCVVVDSIDDKEEDEIGLRVAHRADADMSYESDGDIRTLDNPQMLEAKGLTGGYIDYLRSNSKTLLSSTTTPDKRLHQCQRLAKFISYMRARPSRKQEEKAQREMSFRLITQLVRLTKCLAVVLNKPVVDETVMMRVTKVALDTSRGRTLDIVRILYKHLTDPNRVRSGGVGGEVGEGLSVAALAAHTNQTNDKMLAFLRFLWKIGIVTSYSTKLGRGLAAKPRFTISDKVKSLYNEILAFPVEK